MEKSREMMKENLCGTSIRAQSENETGRVSGGRSGDTGEAILNLELKLLNIQKKFKFFFNM